MQKKDQVLADLDIIVEKTRDVTRITRDLEDVYAEDETKELQRELQESIKSGDYRSIRAKKKLNQLKKSTKELKKSTNKRIKSQIQIRRNIQQTLEKRFVDVTRELQEAKGTYRSRLRQNIMRQVCLTKLLFCVASGQMSFCVCVAMVICIACTLDGSLSNH